MSGGSERNVWGSGTQNLFSLGNGIYEDYENNYSEQMITELSDEKNQNLIEEKIMTNNDSLKKLLSSLEKKNATRKQSDEK